MDGAHRAAGLYESPVSCFRPLHHTQSGGPGHMGARLVEYFNEAHRHGGLIAKLRLAGHTRVTSAEAKALEDTPALLALFEEAMQDIRRDLRAPKETSATRGDATESLRKQLQVFLDGFANARLVIHHDNVLAALHVSTALSILLHV